MAKKKAAAKKKAPAKKKAAAKKKAPTKKKASAKKKSAPKKKSAAKRRVANKTSEHATQKVSDSVRKRIKFDPKANGYKVQNAFWLAQASSAAYERTTSLVEKRANFLNLKSFIPFDKKGTQGFVAANDNVIVVAFRGTEVTEFVDVLTDLKVKKENFSPHGFVHRGFLGAYKVVQKDVLAAVEKLRTNSKQTIWITGHSLGGALAVLCAADFHQKGITFRGLYTYGQPMVGAPGFAKKLGNKIGKKHFRFVNNTDIVPRVPPPHTFKYEHSGVTMFIEESGNIVRNPSFWRKLFSRAMGRVDDLFTPGTSGVHDHNMNLYINHVQAVALKAK
ncbi:MAG: lipase family protein [Verrucomicrobiota bacterium]